METTATFEINEVGEESGNPFNGSFKVKTLLTRRDEFMADERRRSLLGSSPQEAANSLQAEAFMHGQLSVRLLEAPSWWKENGHGLDMTDLNVVVAVFTAAMKAEKDRKEKIKEASEVALKKITKKDKQ